MKRTTRNVLISSLAGATLLGASVVMAGGAGCGGPGGFGPAGFAGPGFGPAMMGHPGPGMMAHGHAMGGHPGTAFAPEERARWHLDALKASLKLQPDQEAAWQAFETTAMDQAKSMGQARDKMWSQTQTLPERAALASEFMKERSQGMEKVSGAMKALYDVLTPEQQQMLNRPGFGMHG